MVTRANTGFMRSLFHGAIDEEVLFPFPEMPAVERESVGLILTSLRAHFAAHVDSQQIDREERISEAVLEGMKQLGLFGLMIPAAQDGLGLSPSGYMRVLQEVAAFDLSIGFTVGWHQSLGAAAIMLFGSQAQRRTYLPRLATGERVAAFALTEPSAGSDAGSIKTLAEPTADKSGYVLRGTKTWVTNGGFADLFIVFARTSGTDESARPRMTAFIVERGPGVRAGSEEPKLGLRGMSAPEVVFDDVFVPKECVLGEVGRGWRCAMTIMNHGRLALAALSIGAAEAMLKHAVERARDRRAFGRSIGEFSLIKDKIAMMMANLYALESATYLTAGLAEGRLGSFSIEAAVCKVLGSETLWGVVNETLQIAGGAGCWRGLPYERLLRDARGLQISLGTNEVLRCFIALSGMQGPAKALAEVVRAVRQPMRGIGPIGDFALRKARAVLGRERLSRVHPALVREAAWFEELAGDLAVQVEGVVRRRGPDLEERQPVLARVADIAIDLYAMAACIARASRAISHRGEEGARREVDLTALFCAAARARIRQRTSEIERNDDELRAVVASRAYADGNYPLDVL